MRNRITFVILLLGLVQSAFSQIVIDPAPVDSATQLPHKFAVNEVSNRLKIGTRLALDPKITNIKDAVEFILEPTGYKLVMNQPGLLTAAKLAGKPIPPMAQTPGNMTIERALLIIIGNENRLVVDHANRLVAVEPISKQ